MASSVRAPRRDAADDSAPEFGPDDEDDDGDAEGGEMKSASPTPSDAICEAFRVGYHDEEVALLVDMATPPDDPARLGLQAADKVEIVWRVVHRRTAATVIRP